MPVVTNFKIQPSGVISQLFLERNITDFITAMDYVRILPYRRNKNKHDLTTIFDEQCGTCSTKHALLKCLADENSFPVTLILGMFRMNGSNMPGVTTTLAAYNLEYIPEAHCYLKWNNEIIDCTTAAASGDSFVADLISEIEITPADIADFKVAYHKKALTSWLEENTQIPYSLDEIFAIRELCIKDIERYNDVKNY